MSKDQITPGGIASNLFVWALLFAILCGAASLEISEYKYRWSHRDDPMIWSRNWRFWDFRAPKEAYYEPFLAGSKWGALVGGVLGIVVAAKKS